MDPKNILGNSYKKASVLATMKQEQLKDDLSSLKKPLLKARSRGESSESLPDRETPDLNLLDIEDYDSAMEAQKILTEKMRFWKFEAISNGEFIKEVKKESPDRNGNDIEYLSELRQFKNKIPDIANNAILIASQSTNKKDGKFGIKDIDRRERNYRKVEMDFPLLEAACRLEEAAEAEISQRVNEMLEYDNTFEEHDRVTIPAFDPVDWTEVHYIGGENIHNFMDRERPMKETEGVSHEFPLHFLDYKENNVEARRRLSEFLNSGEKEFPNLDSSPRGYTGMVKRPDVVEPLVVHEFKTVRCPSCMDKLPDNGVFEDEAKHIDQINDYLHRTGIKYGVLSYYGHDGEDPTQIVVERMDKGHDSYADNLYLRENVDLNSLIRDWLKNEYDENDITPSNGGMLGTP